ncbi:unnamed protein product [Brachionus calyciflorus]|uniref:BZIP domain-containing protein n=1 Tax=Brachionus calyciflorus TaxID=104777 RepID=A0A814GAK8_9BILA|nr:unnamed protein product [Brachionus calyciflorus]
MVKKEDSSQSNDSNLSSSSSSTVSSSSSSSYINNIQPHLDLNSNNTTYTTLSDHKTQIIGMQNLANKLVVAAAAVGNSNSILCTGPPNQNDVAQVYFQNPNDLTNPYKLQAAVHLISQAAQQQQNQHSNNGLKELNREKRNENNRINNSISSSSSSSGSHNGNDVVEVGQETNRKREIRLLKNREAARECRRKKKEYIKCLENRVAVLETQNKTLIDELKSLKELYCSTGDLTNTNPLKNTSNNSNTNPNVVIPNSTTNQGVNSNTNSSSSKT